MGSQKKEVFGTLEWASFNENIISGCSHDCRYCYSKEMAIRFKRKTPKNWRNEEVNYSKLNSKVKKYEGRVMFPSSHDITPKNLDKSISYLSKLFLAGNDILIVTKPHLVVVQKICETFSVYKKKLLFRFTIGSNDSTKLLFWEPFAPSFEERLSALEYVYKSGFSTSISIEPILSTVDETTILVSKIKKYVTDSIWIGKPNFLLRRLKTNGEEHESVFDCAKQLETWCSDTEIKKLYTNLKNDKKIKWKESIKKVVGLKISTQVGLDE